MLSGTIYCMFFVFYGFSSFYFSTSMSTGFPLHFADKDFVLDIKVLLDDRAIINLERSACNRCHAKASNLLYAAGCPGSISWGWP